MPKKDSKIDKDQLVELALKLAEENGWAYVTLGGIALEAGIELAEVQCFFEDKSDIITAIGRMIDKRVLEAVGGVENDSSINARDALFDVLMERFDVLNDYRGGIISILQSFCFDPAQAVITLPHLARSMRCMMETAGVETTGVRGAIKIIGLTGVYIKTLKVWQDDDSSDMVRVMAALDKDLGRADSAINMMSL